MRMALRRIVLLCAACMICMCGLCLAKDGNWIKYHSYSSSKYYVNPSSLKAREYEGRKYLEANVDIGGSQMLIALDIENQKYIVLEGHNHLTGKTTSTDISQMSQQSPTFSGIPIYVKLVSWVEKNRPDVINEIREHNKTAPPLPAGKTDVTGAPNVPSGGTPNVSGDLHSLIYTPLQSENTVLAFCPLDGNGDISEIYLNPYKTGREYIVISTFPYEGGRGYYQVFGTFAYTPDDPDDPSAGGEFLFTGESRSYYYMRARVIGETTLKIEWVTGDTQSGPQTRQPDAIRPYSEDIYELQPITEEQLGYMNHVLRVPYRFVSKHGHIPKFCEADFSAMFAFIDFLNEGNSLDMIAEPPQGMALPGEAGDFKQPGKYRKTGTGVAAAR